MKTPKLLKCRLANTIIPKMIIASLLMGGEQLFAASATWTGTGNTWTDNSNWGGFAFPNGASDQATFYSVVPSTVITGTNISLRLLQSTSSAPNTMTISDGGIAANSITLTGANRGDIVYQSVLGKQNVTLNANVILKSTATTNNTQLSLNLAQGSVLTLNAGKTLTLAYMSAFNKSTTLQVDNGGYSGGGTLNLNSNLTTEAGSGATSTILDLCGGTVNWNVGTLTLANAASTPDFIKLRGTTGTATLNVCNSTLSYAGMGIDLGNNNSNVIANIFGTANGISIASRITTLNAGTGGVANNIFTIGANDISATSASNSTVAFTGNYDINGNATETNARTHRFFAFDNNIANFNDQITGGAATSVFQKTGNGTVIFSGASANTYTSSIGMEVVGGTLQLQKTAGVNALTGNATIDSGASLTWAASNQISDTASLTIAGGTANLNGNSETVSAVGITSGGLKMAANQTGAAQLVATSSVSLGTTNTLDLTGMSTSAGLYKLISGSSLSGTFGTVTGLSSLYALKYSATEVDAQHRATITLSLGSNSANVHVGTQTVNLSVGNTAPTGSADLNYTLGGVNGSGTRTAGSTSAATGSYTATAGVNNFSITANDSNATNSGQSVSFSQTGYNLAASATAQTVNVGITHVGQAKTAAVTLSNTAPTSATYTETLSSNGFSNTTSGFTASGSATNIAGGGNGSGTLRVGLAAGLSAGVYSGTTTLALNSNEVNNSGLGTTALNSQTVTINGQVNEYAKASFSQTSGEGTLTKLSATSYTLDLGSFDLSTGTHTAVLALSNDLVNAIYQDLLSGSFDTTGSGVFNLSGFTTVSDIAISGSVSGLSVAFDTSSITSGTYNGQIIFSGKSVNASGTSDLSSITLNIQAEAVPEPSVWAMLIGGLGSLLMLKHARRHSLK